MFVSTVFDANVLLHQRRSLCAFVSVQQTFVMFARGLMRDEDPLTLNAYGLKFCLTACHLAAVSPLCCALARGFSGFAVVHWYFV